MAKDLKLGLILGYWGANPPEDLPGIGREAEALGYDSIFTAEAWGSDAFTPLAWLGAHPSKIRLGTSVVQLSARTPTATAMATLTLDHLSQGRMILGLGVSGPQVVEGWYGQPFGKPLARTREYVDIIRQVLARERPVKSDGPHYPLPYHGENAWGLGKPLRSITHPLRADVPIFLGAEGPTNVALACEIADNTSAVSVALARAMLWHGLGDADPQSAHLIDSKCIHWAGRQADAYEGVTSFLEKRAPAFKLSAWKDMPDFYPWWKEPKV